MKYDPTKNLETAFQNQDWDRVAKVSRSLLQQSKKHLLANRYLGFALFKLQRFEEAEQAFIKAVANVPGDLEIKLNYGKLLTDLGRFAEARPYFDQITKQRPKKYIGWLMFASCLYQLQDSATGFQCAQKMLALASNDIEKSVAYTQLSLHRRELGQVQQAVADVESAIQLNPDDPSNYMNRQLFMLADPRFTAADLYKTASQYAQQFEQPLRRLWPKHRALGRTSWDKLKIGFLSPDFRTHAVMYFVEGLLAQLDRRQFEVHALYLHPTADAITERVKRAADGFENLSRLPFAQQLDRVRSLGFDVLIDLAGHTGFNGLQILAHKAAPVQVSWLGFPATTGLTAIDYKFTDEVTDAVGADSEYSERLYRMKTLFCCYRPHSRNPLWRYQPAYLVRPTPAKSNGFITFGSCNNLGKLTDAVLTLWGELLQSNKAYRLLIEGKNLDRPEFAAEFQQRCERLGIPVDQLRLIGLDNRNQYLTYHDIDIALDPFPLTGGTTSFDLLWMGVPLVSMEGRDFKSRLSTGILRYLGRSEWLAQTPQEYLAIARALASDLDQLNELRLGLRQQVEASCLMNEDLFVQEFGKGLRHVWQSWLAEQDAAHDQAQQDRLLQQWQEEMPTSLAGPAPKAVGIETGMRAERSQAYEHLQQLLDLAKQSDAGTRDGSITSPQWRAVTEFCETILCALPHDPLALACLAEVEHAHGHTDFAVTYLRYAQEAMQT